MESTRAYTRYALGLMTAVYTLNLVDRGLMFLLLQPIKEDLHLSDTQLGFLTGIAFGLFYATLGLPIARWADRGNRATITALAIGLWGITVMTCLYVTSYIQLVFARMAAAVGEAGCKPPTYSLIGDYFPEPRARTRALAIYFSGASLASLISFVAGGWLNEQYGWRATFFLMGVPGLLLALLVKLTLAEPRASNPQEQKRALPPIGGIFAVLWQRRALRHLCLAMILLVTIGQGLAPWYAAFMMRTHGMGTADLGVWLGLIFSGGGVAGILLGGFVASRWFGDNERDQLRLSALSVALMVPCFVTFLTVSQKVQALIALMPLIMVSNFVLGPTYALLQRLVTDDMRATMLAAVMLLANLIGLGVGPQIVGILSDLLEPVVGGAALRDAMLILSFVSLLASYHFWKAARVVKEDLSSLQESHR